MKSIHKRDLLDLVKKKFNIIDLKLYMINIPTFCSDSIGFRKIHEEIDYL